MSYDLNTDHYVGKCLVHWQTRWAVHRVVDGFRHTVAVFDTRNEALAHSDLLNRSSAAAAAA